MLKLLMGNEWWRASLPLEARDCEDESLVDDMTDELRRDVLHRLVKAGITYTTVYQQSVGNDVIVQAGEPHEKDAFTDTVLEAAKRISSRYATCIREAARTINVGGDRVEVVGYSGEQLPDLSGDRWRDLVDEHSSRDSLDYVAKFLLPGGKSLMVYADQGVPTYAEVVGDGVSLAEWYRGIFAGDGDVHETLAEMGLDPLLPPLPEDYSGPCRVWCSPSYYQGTCGAPTGHWVRDDCDAILEFQDKAAAEAYRDQFYRRPSDYDGIPACNVLAHGQAGADTLTIHPV